MKIVQINATCGTGSTGKICVSLSELMGEEGIEAYILHSGNGTDHANSFSCADSRYVRLQSLKAHILGNWGFDSVGATKKMIKKLEVLRPDIVHLHNIHGHDCHLKLLFNYLKEKRIKVIWTFHDCWAFTGYCTHFTMAGCDKWRTGCGHCPQRRAYSWFWDRSGKLYQAKKTLFSDLDLTIVTPSAWLASLVRSSFLKDRPIRTIHNGIDLATFFPDAGDVRQRYHMTGKHIVLGVAAKWGKPKGLDVFMELADRSPPDYQIVLVGTDDDVDKQLPKNIISIHRTQDQRELAQLYSAADVFVNPTREENYPTVNMEAIACGTPVVTFRTGGSPEILDETCGSVVDVDDIHGLQAEIERICKTSPYPKEACLARAKAFDMHERFSKYIELYREIYDRASKERI